jgi:uridine kinase
METPLTTSSPSGDDADALLSAALSGHPLLGSTRLICIDGPAGSGKTTLAGKLALAAAGRGLTVSVVHMDDVYAGWDGLAAGIANIGRWLLEPLRRDERGGYHRYDWAAGRYAAWHAVSPGGLLVLEGVGAAAAQVDGLASLRVWVELPLQERTARWRARDRDLADPFIDDWQAAEQAYFHADRTRQRADVCWVAGADEAGS